MAQSLQCIITVFLMVMFNTFVYYHLRDKRQMCQQNQNKNWIYLFIPYFYYYTLNAIWLGQGILCMDYCFRATF